MATPSPALPTHLSEWSGSAATGLNFHHLYDQPDEPLYLSTRVEDFAAIWGPLWEVPNSENHASIDHFNVGVGQLYPVSDDHGPLLVKMKGDAIG